MKSIIYTVLVLQSIAGVDAQTTAPVVANTSGVTAVINNITFEFNLGELSTTTITGGNSTITQGLLQPLTANAPLPAVGLDFTAKRLNPQQVQLQWKTIQEISNKGFHVERKKENESNFAGIAFENSKTFNGNSAMPLNYLRLDTNSYTGRTYYRLKQEDLNGSFAYSIIRVVTGDATKTATLKAWPIPAVKEFSVAVSGIQKDVLFIYDASGRLVKQQAITENEVIRITGLMPGYYVLTLKEQKDLLQKIILQ